MIFIAHRGNINGPNLERENSPDYIRETLDQGFDVEIDVWFNKDGWFAGHDCPVYKVDRYLLSNSRVWCHAKDIKTFYVLLKQDMHCFFHQNDACTLTNRGYIWTYPGQELTEKSIGVASGLDEFFKFKCAGYCSDYAEKMRNEFTTNN